MSRKLSNEELRRVLEESDFELSDDDMDSNSDNSDPESNITDQEPSIFADDDVEDPDFDPDEISRSNIVTDGFGTDSPADNLSDNVINSPRPETSRRRTAGEIMRLTPQEINDIDRENGWSQEILPLSRQPYNSTPTLHIQGEQSVVSIYRRILTNEVLDLMVTQTNLYASQLKQNVNMSVHSRMTRWTDVTREEMMKFIALYMLMGIVKFPTFESYWKLDAIYYHPIFHNVNISYNRFSSILRCWHFVDNEAPRDRNERLYKIKPLLDLVINNWKSLLTPDECIVIDESMMPFRGRISFRQYNPSKAHKYGLKIYKLCTEEGFVWNYNIYIGRDPEIADLDKPGSVVVQLCDGLLEAGRIIVCDNYYNSVGLAKYLQQRKTDLCGTLRVNRKELPWAIRSKKMGPKKGEVIARQKDNITLVKWRDKRDVVMISTCHDASMQMSAGYKRKLKPEVVLYYNERKKGIDVSDQLSSYYDPKRKSLAWYKKIALDVLICASVTNATLLYQKLHSTTNRRDRKTVLQTQQEIIREFLQLNNASDVSANSLTNSPGPSTSSIANQHFLTKIPRKEDNKIVRKRCHGCYEDLRKEGTNWQIAAKRKLYMAPDSHMAQERISAFPEPYVAQWTGKVLRLNQKLKIFTL
ncbi:piggyBac transposable element-derived protein 4-like [Chrysoperla carnea]|uniref:piggyBac transposable element-derived protein 4-like n=1 Tax=Chrysoperla carnea TaxID=189513 RepID=UPI001D078C4D|nr:piggyBac transposable element-derived protein 4-like [Chrysoperla carnea]